MSWSDALLWKSLQPHGPFPAGLAGFRVQTFESIRPSFHQVSWS
jgi:hypothetical protein